MKKRILALTLTLALLLASCGGGAKATTMHLMRTEGTVGVSDDGGKDVTPRENLGLYSGYGVDTSSESYAWINLDDVKLTKMDEDSEIAITKDGKHLEIDVVSGNLFFNVTQPLADDESMDIRTSTMVVGIRGTCGWVTQDSATLLEGTVEVTAGEQSVIITAGQMARLTADGEIKVTSIYQENIPAFAAEENLGEDILNNIPAIYPLTVLTRQALYAYEYDSYGEETQILDYFYDEAGYVLREELSHYMGGELRGTSVATYSYDSEGRCVVTEFNGNTHETAPGPGTANVMGSLNGCFADPLVTNRYDKRLEIGPGGRLEITGTISPYLADYYAIYTMDANGYPINIDTYGPDGTLAGNCVLEWAVIDP